MPEDWNAFDWNAFDPKLHKVYEVNVTMEWTTYVVAEDERRAKDLAAEFSTEDIINADCYYYATELTPDTGIPRDARGSLPWGPIEWQGKELTVESAMELAATPPEDSE